MTHQTFSARWHKQIGMTKVGLALEAVQQLRERQLRREELVEHAAAGGWTEGKNEVWWLYQDDELMAEVAKIPNRAAYVAIIWPFHFNVEWGTHISVLDGMRWCEERLRAATLNARVDAAMYGQADWNDGEMNPEHLQHGQ